MEVSLQYDESSRSELESETNHFSSKKGIYKVVTQLYTECSFSFGQVDFVLILRPLKI
jgi:hypothetical protein